MRKSAIILDEKEINRIFKAQIKKNDDFKVDKKLFNLTLDFTMDDWKAIRTTKYYQVKGLMNEKERKKYLLKCVEYYIKHLRFKNKLNN